MKGARRYQRGWSKAKMKVRRYNARGSTHRNGTLEMFCVTWLLTASSIADARAARPSQVSCTLPEGAGEESLAATSGTGCAAIARIERHAVDAHSATRTANRADQVQPSCGSVKYGSSRSGNPIRASSEAKFDRANRR